MADVSEGLGRREVVAWLVGVDEDLKRVQGKLDPLLGEQTTLNARRKLLLELLASFDGPAPARDEPNGTPSEAMGFVAVGESVRARVQRQATEIFHQVRRPLHINALAREFHRRGFEIPGAGRPVNITVHLSGSHEFTSPRRGEWTLKEYSGHHAAKSRSSS